MIVVLGLFLLVSTVVAGLVTIGHHGGMAVAGAVVTSLVVNVGLFVVAFRLLTPKQIPWRDMMPGAILGAAGWTVPAVPRRPPRRAFAAEHEPGVRRVRPRAGPDRVPLPGGPGHLVRLGGQRGPGPAPLAPRPGAAAADGGRQESVVLHRAGREARPEQFVTTGFKADAERVGGTTGDPLANCRRDFPREPNRSH